MFNDLNDTIGSDITFRLRKGEHFGYSLPLLVNPFVLSQRNMRTVIIDEYQTSIGYERCLKAGPFHVFRKGDFVATLRGNYIYADTRPDVPTDMPTTTWMFFVRPNLWIFIEQAEFGHYGNLINCTLGPDYGADQHTNCSYHFTGIQDDGRAYVTVRALHSIKPFEQFFVAYGKEGTNEVRLEYRQQYLASLEADIVRDKVFKRVLHKLCQNHNDDIDLDTIFVESNLIGALNDTNLATDIEEAADVIVVPNKNVFKHRKKSFRSGNQGFNGNI